MDDLTSRAVVHCPVTECPWRYTLTRAGVEVRRGRAALSVPPPAGVSPAETVAGLAARWPVMRANATRRLSDRVDRPTVDDFPALVADVTDFAARVGAAQDDGVTLAHLAGHSREELAAAFGDRLDVVLGLIAADKPAA